MNRGLIVLAALSCAAIAVPQTAAAAGSYGAVMEKGVRGCTADQDSRLVLCFESPSVNQESRAMFLQGWPAAHLSLARWDTAAATLRIRSVSVLAPRVTTSGPVLSYLARADHVTPDLACRDNFQFESSEGAVRLTSLVSACKP